MKSKRQTPVKPPQLFTPQQFTQLTVNTPVVLTKDHAALCSMGISTNLAGTQATVEELDLGNNRVIVKANNNARYYATAGQLYPLPGSPSALRFGKVHVEEIRKAAGNDGIQKAITQRLNDARNSLLTAVTPATFNAGMKAAQEQIRQANLLHSSLAK